VNSPMGDPKARDEMQGRFSPVEKHITQRKAHIALQRELITSPGTQGTSQRLAKDFWLRFSKIRCSMKNTRTAYFVSWRVNPPAGVGEDS
jgi:hypothetical protein